MKIRDLFLYSPNPEREFALDEPNPAPEDFSPQMNEGGEELTGNYKKDKATLDSELGRDENGDLKVREFTVSLGGRDVKCAAYFYDGLVDKAGMNDFILRPLMLGSRKTEIKSYSDIMNVLLIQSEVKETNTLGTLTFDANYGSVILLIEGYGTAISIDAKGWEHRGIESPESEKVLRGPNDAFSEQLRENTALIRHLVRNKSLVSKELSVGTISQTPVSIMYIKNVAGQQLVDETERRISSIDVDYLFSSAELEQYIEEKSLVTLPQFMSTERPDRAARALLLGRVVVLVDGSPYAIVMPTTVFELNESAEDHYLRTPYINMIRVIRFIAFVCSMLLPGIYVAVVNFHSEILPTDMLMSIVSARDKVPFPTIVEIIIMEIALEIIREAGVRVPAPSGTTLSIVGALILGQAAVSAGIVSPILIIVVSIAAIGSFATPNYYLGLSARVLRFAYIFLGAVGGFMGITAGAFVNAVLWTGTASMGVPMFAPVAPITKGGVPKTFIYPRIWKQNMRDDYVNPKRKRQQGIFSRGWKK
ncbi:MAG: spore germination protein [Clostridia bacterium]